MNTCKFMALSSYSWILMSFNLLWIIWINYHSLTLSIAELASQSLAGLSSPNHCTDITP